MKERGITLVEILLVVAAVGILILILANLPNSINLIGRSQHQSLAREIATKQLEDKRAIKYANLSYGQQTVSDSRLNLLPSGNGSIVVEDCDSSVCTQSEQVKTVTVTINWNDNSKPQQITLKTLVAEGGLN